MGDFDRSGLDEMSEREEWGCLAAMAIIPLGTFVMLLLAHAGLQ